MNHSAHPRLTLTVSIKRWPLDVPFTITGYTFHAFEAVVVTLDDGREIGIGEGLGVYYLGDRAATMLAQIEACRESIEAGVTRERLLDLLPPGGARNAVDCALWDLEAKRAGKPVWQLATGVTPRPLVTTFTLSADAPDTMAAVARRFTSARALKLKLTDDALNADRVRAVRAAAPDIWMMVDANQGFTPDSFAALLPALQEARVALVEQPFPMDKDEWLDDVSRSIPLAADESVQDRRDLEKMRGRVDVINIKLDKCGGLTEALVMASLAREMGFDLMVGNMSGSSWSMAPAFVIGQGCRVVDLDGPLYLGGDRFPAASYKDGYIFCDDAVWGGAYRDIA